MITIYHKPTCSTSRKVLQMIRDAGHDPVVIDYVATGWTRAQLQGLRAKGTDAAERGLIGAEDEVILAAMVESPVLVERPIVCGPGGVRLCRPAELVAETLAR